MKNAPETNATIIPEGRACGILGSSASARFRQYLRDSLPHTTHDRGPRLPIARRYRLADVLVLRTARAAEWRDARRRDIERMALLLPPREDLAKRTIETNV